MAVVGRPADLSVDHDPKAALRNMLSKNNASCGDGTPNTLDDCDCFLQAFQQTGDKEAIRVLRIGNGFPFFWMLFDALHPPWSNK